MEGDPSMDVENVGGAKAEDFDNFKLGGEVVAGRIAQPALAWADRDGVVGRRLFKYVGRGLEDGWLKAFGGGEVEGPVHSGLKEGRNDRAVVVVGGVGIVGLLLDV